MARRTCTKLRPARIAPPKPDGPPSEGLLRRKELTMTTMTELREADPDELASVDGGYGMWGFGYIPPCPCPPPPGGTGPKQ
jgi:hypothetical protein